MNVMSWNVNSVGVRLGRLLALLQRHQPDVLCLQELKAQHEQLPYAALEAAGYSMVAQGQKAYNGVAILAKTPPQRVLHGLDDGVDDPQARCIAADVNGVRVVCVYVPNGAEMGTDKAAYTLRWLARLRAYMQRHLDPKKPAVICGDFNVAPRACDLAQPDKWAKTVIYHPDMRAALADVCSWGLEDIFAKHHPEGGVYSWWAYRAMGFIKNDGLRIDLILSTPALAAHSVGAAIDRDERKGERPSDHAPVGATFAWP